MFSASVSVWTQMEISLKQVLHTDITQFHSILEISLFISADVSVNVPQHSSM